ncbi:MAG: hypothetical protein JWP97_3833 [Labilithrix sp.]|nr:hypothetical protein [Labilithrix sp.]
MRLTSAAMVGSALALVTVITPRAAHAQGSDTDRQIAQQLFDDGRTLMAERRFAEACPKFAESQRLDPGGGTLLNLALCHEQAGKTATAWSELRDALGQAVKDGRTDRQEIAQAHIDTLAPRLSRLIVEVPSQLAARDPVILLDTSRLPVAAWNTPIPVDPGQHRVTVSGPGATSATVDVTEPGRTYTATLPALADEPSHEPAVIGPPAPASTARSPAFWPVLGGGGALLVTSLVTGLVASSADRYVSDNCSAARDFCRVDDAGAAATRAKTFAWVSTIALVVGAATVVTAFLLPSPRARASGTAMR